MNIWFFFLEEIKDEENFILIFIMGLIILKFFFVFLVYLVIYIYELFEK